MSIVTITVKCDLDNDEIFGRVHVQTTADRTLDWLLGEFCAEKRVKRKPTFALRTASGQELDLMQTIAQSGLPDGETIFAFNKNPPPPPPELPKVPPPSLSTWWILAACALLLGIIGLVAVVTVHLVLSRPAVAFGVVVDSGTDSSKAFVYSWRASKYRSNAVPTQLALAETTDPIDSPGGVEQMRTAVLTVRPAVPASLEPKSRLFLGATAGMRMVRQVNSSQAESLLADARRALSIGGLRFDLDNATASVRILDGDEEARAAWVTVNYLKGGFGNVAELEEEANGWRAKPPLTPPPTPPAETYGSLDLGGGSVQIAFAVAAPTEGAQPLTVYGQTWLVYSHSFQCYGQAAAERRALGRAISDALFYVGRPVDFPCWQRGYSDLVPASSVFVSPCSDGIFTVPPGKLNASFLITGSGDSSRCRLLTARFFGSFCNRTSCSFNDVAQPDPTGRFLATGAFHGVAEFLNLTAGPGRAAANLSEVSILVDNFCSKSYQPGLAGFPEARLRWLCFDGVYAESLLRGFGFNDSNWAGIKFVDQITVNRMQGNRVVASVTSVSWPLGFAILQSAGIQPMGLILAMPLPVFVFLLTLSILLLAVSVVFACLAVRSRGAASKRRGYSSF